MLDQITPLVITFDEVANIRRTLDKLTWAKRILIIDSGSTDGTLDIIREFKQADVITRPFTSFADQCNFGLSQITTQWALSLDADYELSDALVRELRTLALSDDIAGYRARFIYRIHGHPLRGTLYPPRIVLYRSDKAQYRNLGHGHRVVIDGRVEDLAGPIFHDDRKSLIRWFDSQKRYAVAEADYLLSEKRANLKFTDRIRLMCLPMPMIACLYALFGKGAVLDGWPGWYYTLQRVLAEILIALVIIDRRLVHRNSDTQSFVSPKVPPKDAS
jgi:glycosyltransferase involved in cell wall biosynthesis